MGKRKRNARQREHDFVKVAAWYCQGMTQAEIGDKLGYTQQQICYDLKVIRRRWLESSLQDFNQRKAQELARIDHLERTAWQSWRTSSEVVQTITQQQAAEGGAQQTTVTQRVPYPAGDPRFLLTVQWCIQKRCKLLGLDAPDRLMISHDDVQRVGQRIGEVVLSFVPQEYQELCRQQLEGALMGLPPPKGSVH